MITSRSGRVPSMAPYSSALRPCQRPSNAPWMLAPSTAWVMESIVWSSFLSRDLDYLDSVRCCCAEIPGNDFAWYGPGAKSAEVVKLSNVIARLPPGVPGYILTALCAEALCHAGYFQQRSPARR